MFLNRKRCHPSAIPQPPKKRLESRENYLKTWKLLDSDIHCMLVGKRDEGWMIGIRMGWETRKESICSLVGRV